MPDYPIVVVKLTEEEGGGYLAYAPDLPGCMSDGETMEEALQNGSEAVSDWLEACHLQGQTAPLPGEAAAHAEARERKLLDALQALIEYSQSADKKIMGLERQLAELKNLLREDAARPRVGFSPGRNATARRAAAN